MGEINSIKLKVNHQEEVLGSSVAAANPESDQFRRVQGSDQFRQVQGSDQFRRVQGSDQFRPVHYNILIGAGISAIQPYSHTALN